MKKNVMLAALMLVSTMIFAQRKPHDDHKKSHDRGTYLKKSLLLTDDQYTKVKSINDTFMKQFATIRKDTAMTQGTARIKTKKLRDEHNAQMRTVLNEPQWAKWTEMNKRGKDARKSAPHHKRGRGDARPRHDERG